MNDKEWETFFDLLKKIVNELPGTHDEKMRHVVSAARESDGEADMELEEFVSWNWHEIYG